MNLGERAYPAHIGEGILGRTGEFLTEIGRPEKVAVVTDPTVAGFYLKTVEDSLAKAGFDFVSIFVPEGEEHKNLESVSAIYDKLVSERFDRTGFLIALGGGVIGDVAGFAAATFLRGIPYAQVPTTLLAQVDSSIGGKTGVNHREGKNLIGAFYQPRLVVIDVAALRTLPRREFAAGLAEVIKYGIIEDPELFGLLEKKIERFARLDREVLIQAISASCAIKARVVEKDERESDYRSVLNFGHTIGHALESITGYRRFLHGEAVAIGMVKAAAISVREGLCDEGSLSRIRELILRAGLPTEIPLDIDPRDLVRAMEIDKKSKRGKVRFVLCRGIGKTQFHWLSPEEIAARVARP